MSRNTEKLLKSFTILFYKGDTKMEVNTNMQYLFKWTVFTTSGLRNLRIVGITWGKDETSVEDKLRTKYGNAAEIYVNRVDATESIIELSNVVEKDWSEIPGWFK